MQQAGGSRRQMVLIQRVVGRKLIASGIILMRLATLLQANTERAIGLALTELGYQPTRVENGSQTRRVNGTQIIQDGIL